MTKGINSKAGHAVCLSVYLQHLVSSAFTIRGFWNAVADVLNNFKYIEGQQFSELQNFRGKRDLNKDLPFP